MSKKKILNIREYIRRKAFRIGNGSVETEISPTVRANETTFVNDPNEIQKLNLEEYNVWYAGDGAGLLNFYTRAELIDYNYDPIFNRNKRSYFWSVSATEGDIKRTHSGIPRAMVDTMSAIMSVPHITVADDIEKTERLHTILKENNFDELVMQESRPFSWVEGWGGWKINWNEDISDTPILLYYRANSVDFIYRNRRLVAIVYQDYYTDEDDHKYVLFETRRLERRAIRDENTGIEKKCLCLIIEKELFKYLNDTDNNISKVSLDTLPELSDTIPCLIVEDCPYFLGGPNIYLKDSTELSPGRSIFTGKIDLFDDLDKCLSQSSNAITRSTPIEYIESEYLQRDKQTGQPIMPHQFDRKYVMLKTVLGGDGQKVREPVTITQPAINFEAYDTAAKEKFIMILNGYMSPASFGLDLSREANAMSQREKEKVTIFTRNGFIATEKKIFESLMIQLLLADQLLHSEEEYNRIERPANEKDWGISIKYDEFADASFEAKIETVLTAWQGGIMSDEMAIEYLHKDSPEDVKLRELEFMKKMRDEQKQIAGREVGGDEGEVPSDDELAELGSVLGGNNNNDYNEAHEKVHVTDAEEDNGVPNLVDNE